MGFLKSIAPALSFIPGWGPYAAAGASLIGGMAGGGASGGSGAMPQAGDIGGFYQNALKQVPQITADEIGSEKAALQPLFDQQTQGLSAKEAAMGITNSGAAKADFSDLGGQQAAALASAISPLYQQRMGIQGSILGAMPGAQTGAYGNALQQYYNSQQGLGSFLGGLGKSPLSGLFGGGGGGGNPYATIPDPNTIPSANLVPDASLTPDVWSNVTTPTYADLPTGTGPVINYGGGT